jgi:hypothetical protein
MDEFPINPPDRYSRSDEFLKSNRPDPIEAAFNNDVEPITATEEPDTITPEDTEPPVTGNSPSQALGELTSKDMIVLDITATADDEPDDEPAPVEPARAETAEPDAGQNPEAEPPLEPTVEITGGDITDDPPPPPQATETANEPDRGLALQRLCDYTAVAQTAIQEAIEGLTITPLPEGFVSAVESPEDTYLQEFVADNEIAYAKLQYGDALAATGLKLYLDDLDEVGLRIADPEAFASTLGQTQLPADDEARGRLQGQTTATIDAAVRHAGFTTTSNNVQAVRDILEGRMPNNPMFYFLLTSPNTSSSPADRAFTAGLSPHAEVIASELNRLGIPEQTVAPMRQLAAAHNENLVTEWAAGYCLDLVGHSEQRSGVDRLMSSEKWDDTYRYFEHLARVAPDAQFTRDVRDTVINDINRTLGLPVAAIPLAMRNLNFPMLRAARERIRHILPNNPGNGRN